MSLQCPDISLDKCHIHLRKTYPGPQPAHTFEDLRPDPAVVSDLAGEHVLSAIAQVVFREVDGEDKGGIDGIVSSII